MHKGIIWAGIAGLSLGCLPAHATHTGSTSLGTGNAETINTDSAIPLQPGQSAFGLRVESTAFDRLSDDELVALRQKDEEADLHSIGSLLNTSLNAAFGITDDLTVGIKLPYLVRDDIREPAHGHHEDGEEVAEAEHDEGHAEEEIERLGTSEGFGDLSVYGLWRFRERTEAGSHLALLFGIEAPTGETSQRTPDGHKLEAELQPGSGSWDPFLGLVSSRSFGAWTMNGNVVYTLATEGTQNTDLGDTLSYNAGFSYAPSWGDGPLKWNLLLELNGEWRDKLEAGGMNDGNSGGHWLHLSPGLAVRGDSWTAFATFSQPLLDDANGYQDERDYRFLVGVQFAR